MAPSKQLKLPETSNVGIWIRVSTEDQAKGESPEHHEKRARAYAEVKGWNVIEVYHLEGVSGKAVMQHAEAKRMLKDVETGRIQGLIFSKLARLARNTKELLEFADFFRTHNADLISLQESIDTSTPAGRLFYTMIAAMAQWEREEIAERVAVSIPIRAKLGKPLSGSIPYGYKRQAGKLVIHPDEGPVRKRMYELFAEHGRYKTVARILNDAGHRGRKGKPFSDTEVHRILVCPSAKGTYRSNFSTQRGGKTVFKPESEWVYTPIESLVSEDLWQTCNRMIADRKHSQKPIARRPVQLFAGVTYCLCGQKMYVRSNSPKYVCNECHNKIPIVDLEGVFHEQLKHFLMSADELSVYLKQADQTLKHKEDMLEVLLKERRRIGEAIDKLYELYVGGQITAQAFGLKHKPLEERARQLDDEIPRLQAEVDILKIGYLSKDQIISNAKMLYDSWPSLSHEEKLKITQSLAQKIIVGKGEIDIEMAYLPSSQDMVKGQQSPYANTTVLV